MAVVCDFVMNLAPSYYSAIGEFMFRTGQLEMQLHEITWRVLGLDNRQGRILTIGADIKAIRGMLRNAVSAESRGHWIPITNKTLIQRITTLLNRAKDHVQLRNKLAHGSWQSPVRGKHDDVKLLFMKEQDEKYLARYDPSLDDQHIRTACAKLKRLNIQAQELILDLSVLRGIPPSEFHGRKYLR